jgi:antitoxin component YwqK of YwqJK toxin-antitoxin module
MASRVIPKKSEIKDGFLIKYHANGKTVWSKGKIKDGQPDGYWEWYRPDGTLKRSGTFTKGETVGEWTTYDAKGKVYKVTQKIKLAKGKAKTYAKVCNRGHCYIGSGQCPIC